MSIDLPEYYFRIRENGAVVFRVEITTNQRQIALRQIAVAKVKDGEIKPHGDHNLTRKDIKTIEAWIKDRAALLANREIDDIFRTIDHLNLTAQWAQSRATDTQLSVVSDALLIAMHDLRTVLVRKKSESKATQASKGEYNVSGTGTQC